ncbi:MAG: zinc-dependent alcohol dehydrogenase family protein [Parvibaculum sp.]
MLAMVLNHPGEPLIATNMPDPVPVPGQILLRVSACGVCRTDLHIVDGELPPLGHPIIPGHEIVGTVMATGSPNAPFRIGERVGIPWLGWTCGTCDDCTSGHENLCEQAKFTGYHLAGGYAAMVIADERYCFAIPDRYSDEEAAPLLCAGLIGYRALRMAGDAKRIGIYGFGAAAHILTQIAMAEGRTIYAFTRDGDEAAQDFARSMGATWVGGSSKAPPQRLDAAIIFAPVGSLVPAALRAIRPGGTVVCGGIHMSDIPSFPYEWLWKERVIRSVANLTRQDAREFMTLAATLPLKLATQAYPLDRANEALADLRSGALSGAAILLPD